MKKIFKKNQLMITALALMIAVAGYLHFSGSVSDQISIKEDNLDMAKEEGKELEEEESVEASNLMEYTVEDTYTADEFEGLDSEIQNDYVDIDSLDEAIDVAEGEGYEDELVVAESTDVEEGEIPGEAVFTSTINVNTLQSAKLMKEQTRATNKETLLEIINSTNIAEEQKQAALDSMVSMTQVAEREMAAEILLEAKGFENAVVSMTGNTVDVVVQATDLSEARRAQIEDIVMRKTGVSIENIVISTTLN